MALVLDTSVLYAAMDRRDTAHAACRALIEGANEPLVIPSPVLPEVDYWVSRGRGVGAMVSLLRDIVDGAYRLEELEIHDYVRVAHLMDQYGDFDLGFVDASIIAIVERLGEEKVATLDHRHFTVVRPSHIDAFLLLPE
jgi:uncharacterized protein